MVLGRALRARGYRFITATPETHRRVVERAGGGRIATSSLREIFGWSQPFSPEELDDELWALAERAAILRPAGDRFRSAVRFSSLGDDLLAHSAFPTESEDAVFLGPDTYRFARLLNDELGDVTDFRIVDVGCGAGAGGLVAARRGARIVLADVNEAALRLAAVNAELAGLTTGLEIVQSDVLAGVNGVIDAVIANPPYIDDASKRTYADGGDSHGRDLSLRIVRESLERVRREGRIVLYTGAAIVDGRDALRAGVEELCAAAGASVRYEELDPDVFGEELATNDRYADVERIAVVAAVITTKAQG